MEGAAISEAVPILDAEASGQTSESAKHLSLMPFPSPFQASLLALRQGSRRRPETKKPGCNTLKVFKTADRHL